MMKKYKIVVPIFILFFISTCSKKREYVSAPLLPYRILLITDSMHGNVYERNALFRDGVTQDIAALLKAWSIPFDILPLNHKKIQFNSLFNENGGSKYGVIVWDADINRLGRHFKTDEKNLVLRLLASGSGVVAPDRKILSFKGLWKYIGLTKLVKTASYRIRYRLPKILKAHFIIDEFRPSYFKKTSAKYRYILQFQNNDIILETGGAPILAAHRENNSRSVFIHPPDSDVYHEQAGFAHIFRRSIIWACGYGLYRIYPKTVILRMDDPGTAVPFYLDYWSFSVLGKNEWKKYILNPLEKYKATLDIFMIPAVPWISNNKVSIRKSWKLPDFIDRYGNKQKFREMWESIREGEKKGVFHIQSHGFTHMDSDTYSWAGAKDRFTHRKWYKEFYHLTTGEPVETAVQQRKLKKSGQWLEEYFSKPPLAFGPGGDIYSINMKRGKLTYQVAGICGYGLGADGNDFFYLNDTLVIQFRMTDSLYLKDEPTGSDYYLPAVALLHDRDLRENGKDFLEYHLDNIVKRSDKKVRFMSMDEYCAYIHTDIRTISGEKIKLSINPHPVFSREFFEKESEWYFTVIPEITNNYFEKGVSFYSEDTKSSENIEENTYLIRFNPLKKSKTTLEIH